MLDFGFGELILLGAIALIALGPERLPGAARTVARFINDMKRVATELTGAIVEARDSTDRLLGNGPTANEPVVLTTVHPVIHPVAVGPEAKPLSPATLTPLDEPLSSQEEADRARQMSFPLFESWSESERSGQATREPTSGLVSALKKERVGHE